MRSNEGRATYENIKSGVLEAYYDFCRDRGVVKRMSHLEVLGYVDCEYEDIFESPLENLMLTVARLILTGGWYPEAEKNFRRSIEQQLSSNSLESLLVEVPKNEADLFLHDLQILKLI